MQIELISAIITSVILCLFFSPFIAACLIWRYEEKFTFKSFKKKSFIIFIVSSIGFSAFCYYDYKTTTVPLQNFIQGKYEEVKDTLPKGNSTKKILFHYDHHSLANDLSEDKRIVFYLSNYNESDFEGEIKISAIYSGEIIGTYTDDVFLFDNEIASAYRVDSYNMGVYPEMYNGDLLFGVEFYGEFLE